MTTPLPSSALFQITAGPSALPGTQICYTIDVLAETGEGAGLEPSHVSFGVCPGATVCPENFIVFLDGVPVPPCNGAVPPCWETNPAELNFCALKVNFANGQLDAVGDTNLLWLRRIRPVISLASTALPGEFR